MYTYIARMQTCASSLNRKGVTMNNIEKQQAIQNATPKPPQRIELGGDYYFKCPWASCNTDINQYMNYCPICGQKILWEN